MHPRGNDLNLGRVVGRQNNLILPSSSRDKHLYICGGTGTGKSKFLEHLIRQDILNAGATGGSGLLLLDPHGSLYDSVLSWLAESGLTRPVIPIDLRRDDWIVSYNLLRKRNANPAVVVDNFVEAMAYVWGESGTDKTPLFARWATNTLRALYEKEYTLSDATHLIDARAGSLRQSLVSGLTDHAAKRDWAYVNTLTPKEFEDQIGSTLNRLQRFVRNELIRAIFGQPHVSLDLGRVIEEGAIVLVSLSKEKAKVSKENAELFATLLLNDLWTAAQERGKKKGIKPFYVYLDEFQRFVTPTIAENLDEARGFGLHLTLAHQFPKQLLDRGEDGRRLYNSVMENASSKVVFRLTDQENLKPMAEWLFTGAIDPDRIKHELYSTKVMQYREEMRASRSWNSSWSAGSGSHSGRVTGERRSGSDRDDFESWDEHAAVSSGENDTRSEGESTGGTETPTLIPVIGRELSHVQFESLDEQLFRAMASLFDQRERQCVVRLVGMRAPVSLYTPTVPEGFASPERVNRYTKTLFKRWPFFLLLPDALKRLALRESEMTDLQVDEPTTAKRRVRRA